MTGAPVLASPTRVLMSQIKVAVAREFSVSILDLESARRDSELAHARQVAMFLGIRLTVLSKCQIGRMLGGRDHTTVIHGIRAVRKRRLADADLDLTIRSLERRLSPPGPLAAPGGLQLAMFDGPLFEFRPAGQLREAAA